MTLEHWWVYVGVVAVVIAIPGPAALLCISHGVEHGRLRSQATIAGLSASSLTCVTLSAAGLGAVLVTSELLFHFVRLAGAAYLVYLGVMAWRAPVPETVDLPTGATVPVTAAKTPLLKLFWRGFLIGVSNPKELLFFGALFPQFINPAEPMLPQATVLAVTWLAIAIPGMTAYAAFGSALSGVLRRASARRLFNRITGGIFVVAGAALAAARR